MQAATLLKGQNMNHLGTNMYTFSTDMYYGNNINSLGIKMYILKVPAPETPWKCCSAWDWSWS